MHLFENVTGDERFLWFLVRGTGFSAMALLTLATALGVLATVRTHPRRWPRFATQALHRSSALLGFLLLTTHVVATVANGHGGVRWHHALVPFSSPEEAWWMGLGTIGLDLFLLVVLTGLLRRPPRARRLRGLWERTTPPALAIPGISPGGGGWRALHLLSYPAWGVGVLHGLGIGTDTTTPWGRALYATLVGVVACVVVFRLATLTAERRARPRGGPDLAHPIPVTRRHPGVSPGPGVPPAPGTSGAAPRPLPRRRSVDV